MNKNTLMIPPRNPLDFRPIIGRKYQAAAAQMSPDELRTFDDWQLEQGKRRDLAAIRAKEIELMLEALSAAEPHSKALVALHGLYGWNRGGDNLEDFSRALDASLRIWNKEVKYCLECMERECKCEGVEA